MFLLSSAHRKPAQRTSRRADILRIALLGAICAQVAATWLAAQQPEVTIAPASPAPGAVVRVSVTSESPADSIIEVMGEMAGEELHFHRATGGVWRSFGPVSVDAVGDVTARVAVRRVSGVIDSASATIVIPKPKPGKGKPRALAVASRFTRPLDAETRARVDRENAQAREIGRRAHSTPRMWTSAFLRPRTATVTSRFGSGRMFNGTLSSRHLGVDFRGAPGEPIYAANRGVVALVDDFFLAGNVVYIDHGAGIVTAYFHMSRPLVSAGDTVERGQKIGLVGATGRVTGPHLHWSARYGAQTVNPLDLVTTIAF